MNLYALLKNRTKESGPIRIGLIGAGKFASMFLTQAVNMPEFHVVALADLDTSRAKDALLRTGWDMSLVTTSNVQQAVISGQTAVTDDSRELLENEEIEVILEITGNPIAGVRHALSAIENGKHIIMVNVEADVLAGPILKEKADAADVVYSMAYGDQPALICEMVDWCRASGFEVTAAGKGTKYLPIYRESTPDTVWDYYGFSKEQLATGDFNPKMFNSFLDGTKSAIEMAAVANGTGLRPPEEGLNFPPVSTDELPTKLRPVEVGGVLSSSGTVEVISSLNRDGSEIANDLRWGVYVTFKAQTEYAARCFEEYGFKTDPSGMYGSLYRPYHMIGMELGVSVASAVLRGEPTGAPSAFAGDVISVAKRDLMVGEVLDGEGGYCVTGTLAPASKSLANNALPIGLASGVKVIRPVAAGEIVRWSDVEQPKDSSALRLRKELELRVREVV
ncbi:NAD(P)H-dependent oxidoreductase [Bacillus sp. REN16]|uniref:NAD(P)H-dependent oxidoreductase n=1 Tax=Bacillus sp. REN16 TaxID=2887296 RepID=UPI001E326AF4|nr:SAF domain-containing protein [Bacillus sp. REN16]MCC3359463.1 Gfo/Idh/MocA family oxidoreductase [Bacillus sp. REN16]